MADMAAHTDDEYDWRPVTTAPLNALSVTCPDCSMPPHKACRDLRFKRGIRYLRRPHPSREWLVVGGAV